MSFWEEGMKGSITLDRSEVNSHTILMVDDNIRLVESLKIIYPQIRFLCAYDGKQAIDYLRGGEPISLVMLDYYIPKLSGESVLVYIKANFPDLPVIMMSASTLNLSECIQKGASGILEKPFTPESLESVWQTVMCQHVS